MKRFDFNDLNDTRKFYKDVPKGKWAPSTVFKERDVLIIGTGLEFKNPIERDIDLVTKGSLLNWRLQPKKNMLIIFPSYLHHKIEKNTFDEVRHSLAFNVMPDGATGDVDSKFIY